MNFAQTLDKMMKERNISNYEMSKKTGISDSLIGYWRKGERVPKADNLLNIANFLECSVDYLLGRTDTPNTYSISNQDTTINGTQANVINNAEKQDEMTEELLKAFKSMSFPDKMDIMNAVLAKSEKKA